MCLVSRIAALTALTIATVAAAAKPAATVKQAIAMVRAGIAAHDDRQTAKALGKLLLTERLEPVVVEHLESEGAGPRTMEALDKLADATALYAPGTPPDFPHPPIPPVEKMSAAIHHARVLAATYASNLPNFLCNEKIERYEDLKGSGTLEKRDTLGLRLSYEDKEEHEKLIAFNGRPTTMPLEAVAGARSSGEFGSMMMLILDPVSKGKFSWSHWTLLRGRDTQVYSYRIAAADSHYRLMFALAFEHAETTPAMEGTIYLDGETSDIVRIVNHAADIDPAFPVRYALTRLDYAAQDVGGKAYLLPLRAETRLSTDRIHTRNLMEFSGYRKFEGESTITFGDTDAPPPAKGKQ